MHTLLLLTIFAQGTQIVNPTGLAFTCPDHVVGTNHTHEIAIVNEDSGDAIQTIIDPSAPLINGEVVVNLKLQPIAFGRYRFVAYSVINGIKSAASEPSDLFLRAPGPPSRLTIR